MNLSPTQNHYSRDKFVGRFKLTRKNGVSFHLADGPNKELDDSMQRANDRKLSMSFKSHDSNEKDPASTRDQYKIH